MSVLAVVYLGWQKQPPAPFRLGHNDPGKPLKMQVEGLRSVLENVVAPIVTQREAQRAGYLQGLEQYTNPNSLQFNL